MFFMQLRLLLWKNYIIHRRSLRMTLVECLIPSLFALALLVFKLSSDKSEVKKITYNNSLLGDIFLNKTIGYTPSNTLTQSIMDDVFTLHGKRLAAFLHATAPPAMKQNIITGEAVGFPSEVSAVHHFREDNSRMPYIIVFENLSSSSKILPHDVTFKIRPFRKDSQLWHTDEVSQFDKILGPGTPDRDDPRFAYMQELLGNAVIRHWAQQRNKTVQSNISLIVKRMPYPSFNIDSMYLTLKLQLTLFVVLGFMMSVFMYTRNIVQDKEVKIKESMKLMGMTLTAFWLSWYITCFVFLLPAIGAYTIVLGMDLSGKGPILNRSAPSVIFVLLLCYSFPLITFSFLISCLVQKANDGAIAAGLLYLIEYVPYEVLSQKYSDLSRMHKLLSCLSFNVAIGLGNFNIVRLEGRDVGVNWDNVREPIENDNFTIFDCMMMLLVDGCIHLLLTWYLDNICPGEYGVPKPYLFFLTRSYWCGEKIFTDQFEDVSTVLERDNPKFERDPEGLKIGIEIKKLRKVFGKKVSVSRLTLNIYEDQITVILGHNGAGKTTTMSMLTGFIPPTSGTAIINHCDIRTNILGVRRSLSLCPQHDILFDVLTVKEHLWFFAKLKGYQAPELNEEIQDMASRLGLGQKMNAIVGRLSGGQQRSLSVGISLMGDSKVVFLDEPSSGMDPATRRLSWDVLQNSRKGRTIVLTTHYMDEADALGDRIIIMSEGVVQCCGTSLFLKKLYGAGYHLVIVKEPDCDIEHLAQTVSSFINGAQLENVVNMEVTFLLPDTECATFPGLFLFLNNHKKDLRIRGFGTTATTMEEVFLKSGEDAENKEITHEMSTRSIDLSMGEGTSVKQFGLQMEETEDILAFNRGFKKTTGALLVLCQLKALFVKRAIVAWRHKILTIFSYFLPAIFIILYIVIENMVPSIEDKIDVQPPLTYSSDIYGPLVIPYYFPQKYEKLARHLEAAIGTQNVLEEIAYPGLSDEYFFGKIKEEGILKFDEKTIMGFEFNENSILGGQAGSIYILYNGAPYHAVYVGTTIALNCLAAYYLDSSNYSITIVNHPLPALGDLEKDFLVLESIRSGFFVGLFIGIGMSLFASLVVHFLLRELHSGVKHMQAIFGVSMLTYWIPTFMWDASSFVFTLLILFFVFTFADKKEFMEGNNWILVIIIVAFFVWSMLPLLYAMHFLFSSPSSGLAGVVVFNLFSVLLGDITVNEFTDPTSSSMETGYKIDWVFSTFFPAFNLCQCFNFMMRNYNTYHVCQPVQADCERGITSPCCKFQKNLCKRGILKMCFAWSDSTFGWDKTEGIGTYLFMMFIQGLVFFLLVFAIEIGVFYRVFSAVAITRSRKCAVSIVPRKSEPWIVVEEDDVLQERLRILNTPIEELVKTDSVVMYNFSKLYGNMIAVDHMCLGVSSKECFGLLGESGAGKTTFFRMLTGQTLVSGGTAYINGHNIRTNLKMVQSQIGYCPQSDALIGEMTSKETLTMYGQLRGIPSNKLDLVVKNLLNIVMLKQYTDRACGTYSGGNKRKLSLAIALVGDPPYIFLDEPSTGVDPKARRQMWNVLSKIRACGRTLILTSHSMEECEALCTGLAIMLNGSLKCIGSPQHLKSKYGQGFTLIVKMGLDKSGDSASIKPLVNHIQKIIPNATVFDEHQGYVHLQIPQEKVQVADLFSLMESSKKQFHVEDYSVNETTLEQIFLSFVRTQQMRKEKKELAWQLRSGFFGENIFGHE